MLIDGSNYITDSSNFAMLKWLTDTGRNLLFLTSWLPQCAEWPTDCFISQPNQLG